MEEGVQKKSFTVCDLAVKDFCHSCSYLSWKMVSGEKFLVRGIYRRCIVRGIFDPVFDIFYLLKNQGSKEKMRFQSFFMLMTTHPFFFASSYKVCGNVPDFGVRKSLGRTICIFTRRIIVHHKYHEPGTCSRLCIFQHLLITRCITECGIGFAPDHQLNTLSLTGSVVIQYKFFCLG